jgi:SAM domain (Sterile alpha motif)
MDIAEWLRGLGLPRYERAFHENAIDESVLPSLTADDLKDLGVTMVGHRPNSSTRSRPSAQSMCRRLGPRRWRWLGAARSLPLPRPGEKPPRRTWPLAVEPHKRCASLSCLPASTSGCRGGVAMMRCAPAATCDDGRWRPAQVGRLGQPGAVSAFCGLARRDTVPHRDLTKPGAKSSRGLPE